MNSLTTFKSYIKPYWISLVSVRDGFCMREGHILHEINGTERGMYCKQDEKSIQNIGWKA
jgi:hypothetical protein